MEGWYLGGTAMERSSSASSIPDYRHFAYPTLAGRGKRCVDNYDCHISSYDETFLRQSKRARLASHFHPTDPPAFFIIKEAGVPCAVSDHGSYDVGAATTRTQLSEVNEGLFHFKALPSAHDAGPATRNQLGEVKEGLFHFKASQPAHEQTVSVQHPTSSGLSSVVDGGTSENSDDDPDSPSDDEAFRKVKEHVSQRSRRGRDTKVERVLRSLISPRSPGQEFTLDNDALESIFYAANEIFFCGILKGRVSWDWSDPYNTKFCSRIIGTTALRGAHAGEIETLIILSHHYLRDKQYSRRLLISTFLHEMIHSYLFVRCGHNARRCGGHTKGFRRIARLIDKWAGPDTLFLSNMEADLDAFRQPKNMHNHDDVHGSCNMQLSRHDDWPPPMARSQSAWPDIR